MADPERCAYPHGEYVVQTPAVLAKYKVARAEQLPEGTWMLTMEQLVCGHHLGQWVDLLIDEKGDTTTIRIEKVR